MRLVGPHDQSGQVIICDNSDLLLQVVIFLLICLSDRHAVLQKSVCTAFLITDPSFFSIQVL